MEVWQPFAGEAAGLPYRVTFRLADPSGDQLTAAPESRRVDVLLAAGGAAPVKWQELVVREAQDPPAELLADLTREAHADVTVIAELLSDAQAGWVVTPPADKPMGAVTVLTLATLTGRRVAFQTGWLACPCDRTRQRLRFEPDSGFLMHTQALPLNWHALALNVLGEISLDLVTGSYSPGEPAERLSTLLIRRVQQDPAVQALALQGSMFELRVRSLDEALALMQSEHDELHEQVTQQWMQTEALMRGHVPGLLADLFSPEERAGHLREHLGHLPSEALLDLLLDLDDDERDPPIVLRPDVQRAAPTPLTFPDLNTALGFVNVMVNEGMEGPMPVLGAPDPSTLPERELAAYVSRFMGLLTHDTACMITAEWVARARPAGTPGDVLFWLWENWSPVPYVLDGETLPALDDLFEDLSDLMNEAEAPLFHDGPSFHAYLIAQLEANEYRAVEAVVDGDVVYQAVLPASTVADYGAFLEREAALA